MRAALAVVAASGLAFASFTTELLTESGLDSDTQPLLTFGTSALDRWAQENAILVTGVQGDGVAPLAGDGMVRLATAGLSNTEVRQRVDVSAQAVAIDAGGVIFEAAGSVNATVAGVTGGVLLFAFDAGQSQVGFVGGAIPVDADVMTWEHVSANLVLPAGTRYVEMRFHAVNSTLPVGQHLYGDEASMCLVAAPVVRYGLEHVAVGVATVTDVPGVGLAVANLGSSGLDGVRVSLGDGLSGYSVDFDSLEVGFRGDPEDICIRLDATVGGQTVPGAIDFQLEAGGGAVRLDTDYGALGATSTTVRFLRDGVLLAEEVVSAFDADTSTYICPDGTPVQKHCISKIVVTCDDGVLDETTVTSCYYVCAMTPLGAEVTGVNEISWSRDTGASIEGLTSVTTTGTIDSFTIVDEAVEFGDALVAVAGDGLMDFDANNLKVSNLGSSGLDSVSLTTQPSQEVQFGLLDALGSAPDGASVVITGLGVVDGVPDQPTVVQTSTVTGGQVVNTYDVTGLGTSSFQLELYDGAQLVSSTTQSSGSGLFKAQQNGSGLIYGADPAGFSCLSGLEVWELQTPTGLPPVVADRIVVVPVGGGLVTGVTGFEVASQGITEMDYTFTSATELAWTDLGQGLPGAAEAHLIGAGTLAGNSTNTLLVKDGTPAALTTIVAGLGNISAPFKGGVLVPSPDILVTLVTDPTGTLLLPFLWPTGAPAGFSLYFQVWFVDPAGPKGLTSTNGIEGTTP